MPTLSVNLNKIALLRNQRNIGIPSVARAAATCIEAGADGLTVHPRPDQRHIRPDDVFEIAQLCAGRVEYNIEGNPFPDLMAFMREVRPTQATLVPDDPAQPTSDHGWDLVEAGARLKPIVAELKALGCRVSLFMDPDPDAVARAAELGADRVELYTEPYARAFGTPECEALLERYRLATANAQAAGLGVNAGHDLNLDNLPQLVSSVPGILECSIGHALIADALWLGLAESVRRYRAACRGGG